MSVFGTTHTLFGLVPPRVSEQPDIMWCGASPLYGNSCHKIMPELHDFGPRHCSNCGGACTETRPHDCSCGAAVIVWKCESGCKYHDGTDWANGAACELGPKCPAIR